MMRAMISSALLVAMSLSGCGLNSKPADTDRAPLFSATLRGSTQSPDPVLERVRELERSGVVRDVIVQESFPVQIRLRAPKATIDELERIAREQPPR